MTADDFQHLFTRNQLDKLFPPERADQFFDALFGDASEGAYDIALEYRGRQSNSLLFELHLKQRPGKCLACNLTHGLPTVFSRHPIININELVQKIDALLETPGMCGAWTLLSTRSVSPELHIIPLEISITAQVHRDK